MEGRACKVGEKVSHPGHTTVGTVRETCLTGDVCVQFDSGDEECWVRDRDADQLVVQVQADGDGRRHGAFAKDALALAWAGADSGEEQEGDEQDELAHPGRPTPAPDAMATGADAGTMASVADVVAILESQSAIDTQTAGVFDLSTATQGTDHDPCASSLSAGSSLSGVVSAVVAAATVALAVTGRA